MKFESCVEQTSRACSFFFYLQLLFLDLWQQYHMQTECQVTLIIYKNIWTSFTFKKWTLFLLQYLYFCILSVLHRQRVSNERCFITSSWNMQHSTEKFVIPCTLWYTSYTLLIFVVYNCVTQADVRYCIVEWVHIILHI